MDAQQSAALKTFDSLRPRLIRVAYSMLGSVADAEDVVQEAFIRWLRTSHAEIREPGAFLRTTVTRLCLDQLRSAAAAARRISAHGCPIRCWTKRKRRT